MSTVYSNAEEVFADIVGSSAVMDATAEGIAELARAKAAGHFSESWTDPEAPHFASQIKVVKAGGGKDRLIVNTDPLAIPKELGHILVDADGQMVGYVRGQYSMRNAALEYKGVL